MIAPATLIAPPAGYVRRRDTLPCATDPEACAPEWNGVLWICQTCGEADDMRDPPPVDLRAEADEYAAGCRGWSPR